MKTNRLFIACLGLLLLAGVLAAAAPVSAGGFSALGVLDTDPDLPAVIAVLLQDGFTAADAEALSQIFADGLGGAALLGIDTSTALVFPRADLVSFGLGDADNLDALLRGLDMLYISLTGYTFSDPVIGEAVRFDVRAPALSQGVLASVILPAALVFDPLTFIFSLDLSSLGLDLSTLL